MSDIRGKVKSAQDLIVLYETMDDASKRSLCDFADFLSTQSASISKKLLPPEDIKRPEKETVVGAIKRLKKKYPMVDNMSVFSAASSLMTDHMISGRDSVDVIDEMEILFEESYTKLIQKNTEVADD
ncbi:MAG: Crp/Fnr family transcriptional regulator [Gammaproteobacteria bacterium]|nr:MAG: Crp/Fnr family transcriptional regulator [Gammaproteobacteria bacterium]